VQVISAGAANVFDGKSADWSVCHRKVAHYLRVEVDGGAMRFEAVDDQGRAFDRWTL